MKFDERNPKYFFSWQLRQSLSNRFRFFLAYLVPLDVDEQKRGDLTKNWNPFIKMAAIAMVTKMQKMLNSLRTVGPFET
jgi:hypothetical protein